MKKERLLDDAFRIFIVVITSVIYCLGLVWFLQPAHIYSAGISGLSQILYNVISPVCDIPLGVYTFVLNVPIIIYGWRKVSKRFAIFSVVSVLVQTICTLGWIPVEPVVQAFGLDPIENALSFAIIGGIITGIACGIALRFGTSTGGVDILGQVLAIEKNISIGNFTMVANVTIAVIGGAFVSHSWPSAFNSIIRIILTSVVIDKIHTAYNHLKVEVITSHEGDDILNELLSMHRGCTIIPVEGAYSHQHKLNIVMVISSYELEKVVKIVRKYDDHAFIIVEPVKRVIGNYARKTIV